MITHKCKPVDIKARLIMGQRIVSGNGDVWFLQSFDPEDNGLDFTAKITFCPFCGTKLKDEPPSVKGFGDGGVT